MDKKQKNIKLGEDATKYGEFIPSAFDWLSIEKQKKRAKELDKITKKDSKK